MSTFSRATSDNLPFVSIEMVMTYMTQSELFNSSEFKGFKTARSARSSYGDNAVGYVEVKREEALCTIKAKVTPEHRLRAKPYNVEIVVNEGDSSIASATCYDCASSQGGCKHAVAFLFWLHRRSEEPASTSTISYWKRSSLSAVGSKKVFPLSEICAQSSSQSTSGGEQLLEEAKKHFSEIGHQNVLSMQFMTDSQSLPSLYHLKLEYEDQRVGADNVANFIKFCFAYLEQNVCIAVEKETRDQRDSALWYEIKYGRITASIIHACSRCKTEDGSLVEKILGASQPIKTKAIERGIRLEEAVLREIKSQLHLEIKRCGIYLRQEFPYLGASPDAVGDDFVVEVKCPSKPETFKKYLIGEDIGEPFMAQIQIQMLLTNHKKGLFVVADPLFENNKKIHIKWVTYNQQYAMDLVSRGLKFWSCQIYPKL